MKKVHKIFFAAGCILILFGLGGWQYVSQPYFEGEILFNMKMEGALLSGEKDSEEKMVLFYKGNKMKMMVPGKNTFEMLYDLSNNIEYRIDHDSKRIIKKDQKEKQESAMGMLSQMDLKIEAKPDTLTIAGFSCKRHVITAEMPMMALTIDLFTSEDIRMRESAIRNPILDQMGLETEEIKGFPLGMKFGFHMEGHSQNMMMEAEKVVGKRLSADLFELPKGYKMVER